MTAAIQDLRRTWTGMALALVAASFYVTVTILVLIGSYGTAAGFAIAHVLVLLSVPLIRWMLRNEDYTVVRLVVIALGLKMVGALVRYYVAYGVYGGQADATQYHEAGIRLSESFGSGDFFVDIGGSLIGTRFIHVLTGAVYFVTGPTRIGGFLVYSWLGFVGLLFFYRAFRVSYPDVDGRRYVYLLFFLPSVLFWPSSIGKEAWMLLTIGVATYGAALFMQRRGAGVLPLALGLLGSALVRPHITITLVVALLAASLVSRYGPGLGGRARLAVAVLALIALVPALGAVEQRFQTRDLVPILDQTAEQSGEGGSEFDAVAVRSPQDVPLAVISVLFRPFPFEAGSPLAMFAAAETTFLLWFAVRHRRTLVANLRRVRDHPYLVFTATYGLLFCVAFSNIANFGILARQRVQLLPLALVLLCAGAGSGPVAPAEAAAPEPVPRRELAPSGRV